MERISFDEYFKEIVIVASKRSSCKRLKVGAAVVSLDNRIISMGYNGTLPGFPNDLSIVRDGHEQATIHAEVNALLDCARRGASCQDSILYTTHFPCLNCFKALASAGVKHVKYINDYNNDDLVYKFAEIANIKLERV